MVCRPPSCMGTGVYWLIGAKKTHVMINGWNEYWYHRINVKSYIYHSLSHCSLLRNRILLFITHILAVTRAMTGSVTLPGLFLTLVRCVRFCFLDTRTAHEVLKLRPKSLNGTELVPNLRLSASLSRQMWVWDCIRQSHSPSSGSAGWCFGGLAPCPIFVSIQM